MERRIIQDFIEIYRSEPSLWKVKSCHYNNKTIKNVAYQKLLAKLKELYPDADIELVKKKINALRTNFRKELRKVEASKERSKVTGEPVYVPSLWYFELFHFIADQENDLKSDMDGGIDLQDMLRVDLDENMYYEAEESDENFDEEYQVSSPESQKPSDTGPHTPQSTSLDGHRSMVVHNRSGFKRKREVNYGSENEWFPKLSPPTSYVSPPSTSDGHEIFGRYVASKLKKMDKSMQMLSERLISEILFRGQMGYLNRNTTLTDGHQKVVTKEETVMNSFENV